MRHFTLWIVVVTAAATGCQTAGTNQVPAVDPFAMYGHTRIAPPTTGSYGVARGNSYYPDAAQAGGSAVETMASAETPVAAATFLVDATKQSTGHASSAHQPAAVSDTPTVRVASHEEPLRIVERVGSVTSSSPELRGMAMVDMTNNASSSRTAVAQANTPATNSNPPSQFQPVEGSASIRVLPSDQPAERPLPVRGFSSPSAAEPLSIPPPTPTNIRPSATIQAGRFVPLEIATRRNGLSQRDTAVAATGN